MSALIKEQYDLVKDNDPNVVCCTNYTAKRWNFIRMGS